MSPPSNASAGRRMRRAETSGGFSVLSDSGLIGRLTRKFSRPIRAGHATRPEAPIKGESVIVTLLGLLVLAVKVVAVTRFTDVAAAPADLSSVVDSSGQVLVEDHFDGEDGVITGHESYEPGTFPANGTSAAANPSPIWEGDNGHFYRVGHWGYSGRPNEWKDRYFFRMNTRSFAIGDASFSWRYRSAAFGDDGWPVEGSDAVDVWLRYQTQYNLYALQFDRTDDTIQAKRKLPAQGWKGPDELLANKGVYYTLPTDASQPVVGPGKMHVAWREVEQLLPASERQKPRFPNLAHDAKTAYDFRVTVKNLPNGNVQLRAYRAGVLVYSATDDGRSGVAANGETQGQHVDRRAFDSVPGWQPDWARPITHPGACGFRADDIQFWVADVIIREMGDVGK
jgi:hypothetical protein